MNTLEMVQFCGSKRGACPLRWPRRAKAALCLPARCPPDKMLISCRFHPIFCEFCLAGFASWKGKQTGVLAVFLCPYPLLTSWVKTGTLSTTDPRPVPLRECLFPIRRSMSLWKHQHSWTHCEGPFLNNAERTLNCNPP